MPRPRRLRDADAGDIIARFVVAGWFAGALALFALFAAFIVGCSGGGFTVGGDGRTVATGAAGAALASGNSLGAAAALGNAVAGAGWFNAAGILCIIGGGVCLGHPSGPNGVGFGLLLSGVLCLLCGAVLPLLAGWLGVGLVGLLVLIFAAQRLGWLNKLKPAT